MYAENRWVIFDMIESETLPFEHDEMQSEKNMEKKFEKLQIYSENLDI